MINKYFLFIGSILLLACQHERSDISERWNSNQLDSLTRELQKLYQLEHIRGFGVAIVSADKVLYEKGFGYADHNTSKYYTKYTLQNIGSVSKTLIGIALLKTQELGKLHLDDPVNDYLPFTVVNPYYPEIPITIRQLATHTSTITDTEFFDKKAYILADDANQSLDSLDGIGEIFNAPSEKIPMGTFLERLLSERGTWYRPDNYLDRAPGAIFEYSNVGATLAAYIIERATEVGYDTFTSEHILKPLAMSDSGWSFKQIDRNKQTLLYRKYDSSLPAYELITYPDGGLITSVHDLSKYLMELIRGKSKAGTLLSGESYAEFFKPQLDSMHLPDRDLENPYDDEYNSGIFMGITPQNYLGHIGGDPGIVAFMFFDPKIEIGKILMINTSITTQGGLNQFYSLWETLEKYERL